MRFWKDLSEVDKREVKELLSNVTGSKESIKAVRRWTLDRSNSMYFVMQMIYQEVSELAGDRSFTKILHLIYVVNDILVNVASSGPDSQLKEVVLQFLPSILQIAHNVAGVSNDDQSKISKMNLLWLSKCFIDEQTSSNFQTAMLSKDPIPPPKMAIPPPPPMPPSKPHSSPGLSTNMPPPLPPPPPPLPPSVIRSVPNQEPQRIDVDSPRAPLAPTAPPPAQPFLQPFAFPQIFPTIPPSIPPPTQMFSIMPSIPMLQLHQLPVGTMVNMAKAAMKSGQAKYNPIDVRAISYVPPHVEPGRLEARLNEFYRLYQESKNAKPKNDSSESRRRAESFDKRRDRQHSFDETEHKDKEFSGRNREDFSSDDRNYRHFDRDNRDREQRGDRDYRDRDERGDRDYRDRERDVESERPSNRQRSCDEYRARSARYSNWGATATSDDRLNEENLGHKLLKGMGWQEGSGLGVEGSGRVEPIRSDGQQGTGGVGSEALTDVSSYRQQLSQHYHTRIADREKFR